MGTSLVNISGGLGFFAGPIGGAFSFCLTLQGLVRTTGHTCCIKGSGKDRPAPELIF